jgi:hypothetical protein
VRPWIGSARQSQSGRATRRQRPSAIQEDGDDLLLHRREETWACRMVVCDTSVQHGCRVLNKSRRSAIPCYERSDVCCCLFLISHLLTKADGMLRLEDKIVGAPRKSGPRVENWRGFIVWSPRVVVYVGCTCRDAHVGVISQAVSRGSCKPPSHGMYPHAYNNCTKPIKASIIAITRIRGWPFN